VFRVRVALARDDIHAYGEAIPLQPGMLLTADIVFDRRSLIRWLFDPLFAVAERS
jgi:membrane fusion protein